MNNNGSFRRAGALRALWMVFMLYKVSTLLGCSSLAVDQSFEVVGRQLDQSPNRRQSAPCGTSTSLEEVQRAKEAFKKLSGATDSFGNSTIHQQRRQDTSQNYVFDVHWYVVASNFSYNGGWVPDSQITAQMALLNTHYRRTGISWNHTGTTRIINRYWHESITSDTNVQIMQLMSTFKVPEPNTLNIYTLGFYRDTINGFSSLPVNYVRNPTFDGIMILFNTLPGGSNRERQGSTITHESGHWLGLSHTFAGGCAGIGDGVDDTPPEAEEAFGCPVGRDTCPGGGPDPIYNFMDYTDDSCRSEFTPSQVDLMHRSIRTFRLPSP